jgi:spermidine/putrescine transport system permease protein
MSSLTAVDAAHAAEAFQTKPSRMRPWRNPWRRPWFLSTLTWLYIIWSLVPVVVAVQFSFNAGRSRSVWQGFSFRWYWGDPFSSLVHDPSLRLALRNSMVLGVLTVLVSVPLGVLLALGLTRWRSKASAVSNGISLVPLVTPEIVLGSALYLVFTTMYSRIPLGMPAMVLGHVTFSISYILVIVRSRLLSIGPEFEMAARDLGATSIQALRTILVPLLMPAIVASAAITFASSIDDFVVSSFLYGDAANITVPIKLYSAVRAAPTPALNALATVLLLGSTLALLAAYVVLRGRRRGGGGGEQALAALASFE